MYQITWIDQFDHLQCLTTPNRWAAIDAFRAIRRLFVARLWNPDKTLHVLGEML